LEKRLKKSREVARQVLKQTGGATGIGPLGGRIFFRDLERKGCAKRKGREGRRKKVTTCAKSHSSWNLNMNGYKECKEEYEPAFKPAIWRVSVRQVRGGGRASMERRQKGGINKPTNLWKSRAWGGKAVVEGSTL